MHQKNKDDLTYFIWIVAIIAIFYMAIWGPKAHGAILFVHEFDFHDNADQQYIDTKVGVQSFRPIPQWWDFNFIGNSSLNTWGELIYHYHPGFVIDSGLLKFNIYNGGISTTNVYISTNETNWYNLVSLCGINYYMDTPLDITQYVNSALDVYIKILMYTPSSLQRHAEAEFAQTDKYGNDPGYKIVLQRVPEPSTFLLVLSIPIILLIYRKKI